MMDAPKVMCPMLPYWPMMSEVEVGVIEVEVEPSCQHSITFCCYMTDDSEGAI